MKTIPMRRVPWALSLLVTVMLAFACESPGETAFGKPCETGEDCISGFCVGGETGTQHAPFCSDDCTGRKTGDACGDGRGKCIADFVSWCWMPCESNVECVDVNSERSQCSVILSGNDESPFKVCIAKPQM